MSSTSLSTRAGRSFGTSWELPLAVTSVLPGPVSTNARRIELGYALRQLRERAGMALEEVVNSGAIKGLCSTKLHRAEKGLQDLRSAGESTWPPVR